MTEDDGEDETLVLATAGDETSPQTMLEVYREQARRNGHVPLLDFAKMSLEDRFELVFHMVIMLNRMMLSMTMGEDMKVGTRSAADILKKTSN